LTPYRALKRRLDGVLTLAVVSTLRGGHREPMCAMDRHMGGRVIAAEPAGYAALGAFRRSARYFDREDENAGCRLAAITSESVPHVRGPVAGHDRAWMSPNIRERRCEVPQRPSCQ
jgi:hypothetical protein